MTQREFFAKHGAKFAREGLTHKEKVQRYENYLRSTMGEDNLSRDLVRLGKSKHLAGSHSHASKKNHTLCTNYRENGEILPGLVMSPSSERYLFSLGDPFYMWGANKVPKCPYGNGAPTQSVQIISRGSFKVGVNGTGGILMSPLAMTSSSLASVVGTSASNTANAAFQAPGGGVGVVQFNSNSPYDHEGSQSKNMGVRIVSSGIKCKYVDKLLDRSGIIYEVAHPGGEDLFTYSENLIQQALYRATQNHSITDDYESYSTIWSPTLPRTEVFNAKGGTDPSDAFDLRRPNASSCWSRYSQVSQTSAYNLGMLIVGAEPGTTFYFEASTIAEFFVEIGLNQATPDPALDGVKRYASMSMNDPTAESIAESSAQGVTLNALDKNAQGDLTADSFFNWVANAADQDSVVRSLVMDGYKNFSASGLSSKTVSGPNGPVAAGAIEPLPRPGASIMPQSAVSSFQLETLEGLSAPSGFGALETFSDATSLSELLPEVAELAPLLLA